MCHDGHFSSPLPCFVRVGWVVSCCFLVGELIFDLFLTSSNNLTATVESNAAIEKKKKQYLRPGVNHTETGSLDISFSVSDTSDCLHTDCCCVVGQSSRTSWTRTCTVRLIFVPIGSAARLEHVHPT